MFTAQSFRPRQGSKARSAQTYFAGVLLEKHGVLPFDRLYELPVYVDPESNRPKPGALGIVWEALGTLPIDAALLALAAMPAEVVATALDSAAIEEAGTAGHLTFEAFAAAPELATIEEAGTAGHLTFDAFAAAPELAAIIGRRVFKEFPPAGVFEGVVLDYNASYGWWLVLYQDGDREEYTWDELRSLLLPGNVHDPASPLTVVDSAQPSHCKYKKRRCH